MASIIRLKQTNKAELASVPIIEGQIVLVTDTIPVELYMDISDSTRKQVGDGGIDSLIVNLANMVSGTLGIPNGGHGKTTRPEGLANLFNAEADWGQDANLITTWGVKLVGDGWSNLPGAYGTLVSLHTGNPAYMYYTQIFIASGGGGTYYRVKAHTAGWDPWIRLNMGRFAAGKVALSVGANGTAGVLVTGLPSGLHAAVVSPVTVSPNTVRVSNGNIDYAGGGYQLYITAHSTVAQTVEIFWIATSWAS